MSNETQGKWGLGALFYTVQFWSSTLTASKPSISVSAIGWWVLMYSSLLSHMAITSELSTTTYPGKVGFTIKSGIKPSILNGQSEQRGFALVNVGLWMPAVYIMFAGMFAELFMPDLSLWGQIAICILLTWLTVLICNVQCATSVCGSPILAVLKLL
ncbi:hypothetical protein O9992_24275 [Vibrio lentus]|nr:hypothetical protein [Vibrio lentus]